MTKPYQKLRRTAACLVIVVLLVPLYLLVRQNLREASVRDSFTLMKYSQRGGAKLLAEYRKRFGQLPPRETTGTAYLPLASELVAPVRFDALTTLTTSGRSAPGTVLYSGPPIDPYRAYQIFPTESQAAAVALGHDGNIKLRGYPLRYCRVGKWAVLISNGPDRDVDVTLDDITKKSSEGFSLCDFAATYAYDPTNGTLSSGDCMHVLDPSDE